MDLVTVTTLFVDLPGVELIGWVERGWVRPEPAGESWDFHEIDVARVRLIRDLRRDMDVAEDMIPMLLSLLDQVYELRFQLKAVLRAVDGQPPDVRDAILAAIAS